MAETRDHRDELPLLNTGWRVDQWSWESPDRFWSDVAAIAAEGVFADGIDEVMGGRAAPRVWLVVYQPDQPQAGAAVAFALAGELAGRDQAAVVLDCDDQQARVTAWAEMSDQEGWIDVACYGTSLTVAGRMLPFDGCAGRFLGVGSFAPTDITPPEIEKLLKRLRLQADDVILLVPEGDIRQLWTPFAGIKLLCWDREGCSESQLEQQLAALAAAKNGMTGLVAFGEAAEVTEASELPVDRAELGDDFGEIAVEAIGPVKVNAAEPEASPASVRGTSSVFWFLISAAVVIVGLLGTYWYQYVREPVTEALVPSVVKVAVVEHEEPAAEEAIILADTAVGIAVDTTTAPTQVPEQFQPQEEQSARGAAGPFAGAATSEAVPEVAAAPVFATAPYEVPVGEAGWALHVYSFSKQAEADQEVAVLQARGLRAVIRAVELPAKGGRWWRVYLGSFATRQEAAQAQSLLLEKLRTDWAQPVRF